MVDLITLTEDSKNEIKVYSDNVSNLIKKNKNHKGFDLLSDDSFELYIEYIKSCKKEKRIPVQFEDYINYANFCLYGVDHIISDN